MVCKLFSFFSWFYLFEFVSHFLRFGNVLRLGGLCAADQQDINSGSRSRVINPISRPDMNTHFGNSFADGLAIAEISKRRARKASQDSGLRFEVGQTGEPSIEIRRPKQFIQGFYCIRVDTLLQAESRREGFSRRSTRTGNAGQTQRQLNLQETNYVGFVFSESGAPHYGWARMEVTFAQKGGAKFSTIELLGWGYEAAPNTAIAAGNCSAGDQAKSRAPDASSGSAGGSLGVLALGSASR